MMKVNDGNCIAWLHVVLRTHVIFSNLFYYCFLTVHILQSEKVKVYGKLAILNKSILQFVNLLFRNLMENNM